MNGSISLSVHWWRGIGPDIEPDLFLFRWRLGFLTFSVCRVCLLTRYRELQALVDEYTKRATRDDGEK
jgi:hypothetical protein